MKKTHPILAVLLLPVLPLSAAVVVTDSGLATPSIGANDTGFTGTTNSRFGWDAGEGFIQTFTIPTAGVIQSIFLGYNAFDNGETLTLDLSVNGNLVEAGIVLDGNNFSGSSGTDDNDGEFYWMEFDLSSEGVPVFAGVNSFTMEATADTGASWAFAPRYSNNVTAYTDGAFSLNFSPGTSGDFGFAVTVVPEPSSTISLGFAALGLLARRRRG